MPDIDIRKDLIRNVITEPLYSEVKASPNDVFDVMIDVNMQYHLGRDAAFHEVTNIAKEAVGTDGGKDIVFPYSLGSSANPYMSARLTGRVVQEMVRIDAEHARRQAEEARRKEGQRDESGEPARAVEAPLKVQPYRAIYRIWKNFKVRPLIDKSVSTVKADAARRAFLAEGREVVWAVVDSGIDKNHAHFKDFDNLNVKLPVKHCDFTVPNGEGAESALTDAFGHGTHVAGIIAGGVLPASDRKINAVRTRMDPLENIVEDVEPMDSILAMAPSCKLVSMKVLDDHGDGDVGRIIAALDTIQRINDYGRQIQIHGVNLSLGYEFDPRWFACGQSPICVEVNRLVSSGVVVVVAAGNTGYGALSANVRTTGAGFMLTINDPGNADLAITVGSTHRDMPHTYGVSYFSSKGPTGDGRPKPDLVAPGERILSCQTSAKHATGATTSYVEDSGTSMAAPHVSGVIAAFLSIRKEYIGQPLEVKRLFLSTATDLKRDRMFQGQGLVDLMRAIQSI